MALEHAILVSLMEQSASGYELARRFDRSIGHFWNASHQQIYRTLKRMHRDGWVDLEHISQESRPDKKVYTTSSVGSDELREWISTETTGSNSRVELVLKLRGASYGDISSVREQFEHHRDAATQRLDVYRRIEKHDFPDPTRLSARGVHQHLVLTAGLRIEEGFIAWCSEVLDALAPQT